MAERRRAKARAPRIRAPRITAAMLDPLRPGRHTARRQATARAEVQATRYTTPPPPPASRTRVKGVGGARSNVEARTSGQGRSEGRYGYPVAPIAGRPARQRPYPAPKATTRQRKATVPARSELGARSRIREAQGHEPTRPHPESGEGARARVKAVGKARRPPAVLPGDTASSAQRKHRKKQRNPQTFGADFAGPMTRGERAEAAAQPVHPFFRPRGGSRHIGRPPA